MPPQIDGRREEAKRLYLESKGEKTLQMIADELGVSLNTLKSWKTRDKWKDARISKKAQPKGATKGKKKGATKSGYFGNRNAAGPRADVSGYLGNSNALKSGRYETIKYDTMSEEEKELIDVVTDDPITIQVNLIRELEVRERRMLHRIAELQDMASEDNNGLIIDAESVEQKSKGDDKKPGNYTLHRQKHLALEKIQDIENALSFVQRNKQTAIATLHKLKQDKTMLEIEQKRLELQQERMKIEKRRLALIDPDEETDTLAKAKELLEGIDSAF